MKPVAVIQHSAFAEPGYVAAYFGERGIPWTHYRVDLGDLLPRSASGYSGLCLLGGSMSVNDPLPWIAEEMALVREADRLDIPVIGHCFGSQLLAKTFGAAVRRNAVKEIGWGWITAPSSDTAREWLGTGGRELRSFQWHGDTFEIPAGAELILSGRYCANQGYVIRGLHMGMQSHLEMTPELVRKCAAKGEKEIADEIARNGAGATQTVDEMLTDLDNRTAEINATMRNIYDRWSAGLKE
jgi:GMP synthase-like glutamine amidotransferase